MMEINYLHVFNDFRSHKLKVSNFYIKNNSTYEGSQISTGTGVFIVLELMRESGSSETDFFS